MNFLLCVKVIYDKFFVNFLYYVTLEICIFVYLWLIPHPTLCVALKPVEWMYAYMYMYVCIYVYVRTNALPVIQA